MKINFKHILMGVVLGSTLFLGACEDTRDALIEELNFSRVISPVDLTAKVVNRTNVVLNWDASYSAEKYVVEFSDDNFTTIAKTVEVTADKLPLTVAMAGETLYTIRVKGVREGKEDSKYTSVTAQTDSENIFNALPQADIAATSVTLSWPAGSEVTHLVIAPGDVTRQISSSEKAAGKVVVTGLTGETQYTVTLKNNTKTRGTVTFKTLIDLGNAIVVNPTDDLSAVLAAANDGDVFALLPGNYAVFKGKINITKSIQIKGAKPDNKPVIYAQFIVASNGVSLEIDDVEAVGNAVDASNVAVTDHFIQIATSGVSTVGSILVNNSVIRDYPKSLLSASSGTFEVGSVTFNGCVVTNILTSGADFIDFRTSLCAKLNLTNSTFNTCAVSRDFIRMDAASAYSSRTTAISIDKCTFYKVATGAKRLFYVRLANNSSTVSNSIIAETNGYYSNQSATVQPVCLNNNYFNAADFMPGSAVASVKVDNSGTHKNLDPGFSAAASGNFKVSNQTLIDANIGDPRWLK